MSVLELKNLSRSFGGVRAVDEVDIGFDSARITALIGPNGAGKTTVFNLISGFIKEDSGEIYYGNRKINNQSPWKIAQMGIGRLFQDVRVFKRMRVLDNVLVAFRGQKGENPLLTILTRWKVKREEKLFTEKAFALLRFVGLSDQAHNLAEDLSYGQQKLLSIARLLAADAEVLLLDEPSAGVNPAMVRKLLDVINGLPAQGKTVIIIEHNMNVVLEISHWVYFMDHGQVVQFGLPSEVLGDPDVRKAYIGLKHFERS